MPNLDRRTLLAEVLTVLRGRQAGLFLAAWSATPAGPLGPAVLAQPPRDYTVMASKNIFLGVPAAVAGKPTILCPRSTWLSQISSDDNHTEAFFWDVVNNNNHKNLRVTTGYDSFPFIQDASGSRVVGGVVTHIDPTRMEAVIKIELSGVDPPRSAQDRQRTRDRFFHLDVEKLDKFKKDKSKIKPEEWEDCARDQAARDLLGNEALRVDRDYWESLVNDKIIERDGSDDRFRIDVAANVGSAPSTSGEEIPRVQFVKGKILRGPGADWYVRCEEKYYAFKVGQTVEDGLKKPLTDSQVKELKALAQGPAGGGAAAP